MVELHAGGLAAEESDMGSDSRDVVPSGSLCADDWGTPVIDGLSIGRAPSHVAVSGEARSPRGRICISQDRLDHGLRPGRAVLPASPRERCEPARRADARHPSQRAAGAAGILGTPLLQTDRQSRRSPLRSVLISAVRAPQPTGLIVGAVGAGSARVGAFLTKERGKGVRNWLLSLLTAFLLVTELACAHPSQPPQRAADVGFTTPALIADFSASNAASLINCNIGDTTPSTFFFQGNIGRILRNDYTCGKDLRFVRDPVAGKRVLEFRFLESQIHSYPCSFSNGSTQCNGLSISTESAGFSPVATDYPMGYYEYTYRMAYPGGFPGVLGQALWSWTVAGTNVLEIDFNQSDYSDATNDPCGTGLVDWANGGAFYEAPCNQSFSSTAYKTLGVLFTGNGSIFHFCLYINNIQQNCIDYAPSADQATQRHYIMIGYGAKCNANDGDASCFGSGWGEADLLVQSVRVFTCADWQTSMCYAQGPGMVAP